LALLTVASALGLKRVFVGHSWIWPVALAIAVAHGSALVMRRRKVSWPLAIPLSLAAVVIALEATVLHHATWHGLPTTGAISDGFRSINQSWRDFSTTQAPVYPTPGFELLAAGGAGLVAISADAIAFRLRSVLPAVLPGIVMFIILCAAGQGPGRGWIVSCEVLALCTFVLGQAIYERATSIWLGSDAAGATVWAVRAGVALAAPAVVVAMLLAPLPRGSDGHGAFGWRGHSGTRIVDDPTVDMRTQLLDPSDYPMFTVESQVASYWRLTTLATFTGDAWTSSGTYRTFGSKLPGLAAVPAGTQTVDEQFQIQLLDSPWLPDAFDPVSVAGVKGVTYDPGSGSLITKNRTSSSMGYEVTSYRYLSSINQADLEAAPAVDGSTLQKFTELPKNVPQQIRSQALAVTAGKATEYDKAIAIQQYLRSKPFSYSLHPANDGSGDDALSNFLFVTHQGYCQQFAGAFAVLAREAGLPTRVAIGFAQGYLLTDGHTYQVLENDAHAWPEVYFGPRYGWLPFEPTPTFSDPSASGYDSQTAGPQHGTSPNQKSTGAASQPSTSTTTPTQQAHGLTPKTLPAVSDTIAGPRARSPWGRIGEVLGFAALVMIAWVPLNLSFRRIRWRLRRRRLRLRGPAGEVLSEWADVAEMLAWRGAVRRHSETLPEFATRASSAVAGRSPADEAALAGWVSRLVTLADQASFSTRTGSDETHAATDVSRRIRRSLIGSASRGKLVSWAFLPAPGLIRV
jgi:transglutaminase-like putative cysteine protease